MSRELVTIWACNNCGESVTVPGRSLPIGWFTLGGCCPGLHACCVDCLDELVRDLVKVDKVKEGGDDG